MAMTVLLAIVATVSGLIASVFSASRMLGMLASMKQIPQLYRGVSNPGLVFTVALAMLLTILFDLTRIASIGAIFYLLMDITIHWGLYRHLLKDTGAHPAVPLIAIGLDLVVLGAFLVMKYQSDPLVLVVAAVGFLAILLAQRLFMISHTDADGVMHMQMEMGGKKPEDMDM